MSSAHTSAAALDRLHAAPMRMDGCPPVRLIVEAAAQRFGVSYLDILSSRRTARVVLPRQIAAHLARKHTARSLTEIGRLMGGRDHTTILHSCAKVEQLLARPDVARAVGEIEMAIGCGQLAMAQTGSRTFEDVDVVHAAQRVLDHDACRVSADEVRAMAALIRAHCLPLVEIDDPLAAPAAARPHEELPRASSAPPPAPPRERSIAAARAAAAAWRDWRQAQFTRHENCRLTALDAAMTTLETALQET
jgi:7,8-dihydro-6-hydroxymethylpterin-pyrophosphokinase